MTPTPTPPATPQSSESRRQATEQELARYESEGGATAGGEQPDVKLEQRDDRSRGARVRGSDHRGRILLVYAAKQPHTVVIADVLATRLRRHGFCVEVGDAGTGMMPPPEDYDVVILGAPMSFGRDCDLIASYIEKHRRSLAEIPSALFTVSNSGTLRDHDPGGFLEKFLGGVEWQPTLAAAFAGGQPYPRDGLMVRLAQRMGRQAVSQDRDVFRTDWIDVDRFADAIATELAGAAITAGRTEPHAPGH